VNQPLPGWVTITVVLGVLGLLAYNVIVVGPEGYPISVMLGGLLGAYGGLRELLNRKGSDKGSGDDDDAGGQVGGKP
jgi:hypothetical protein